MYSLILGAILGYLPGSVPTAYLLVRWKSKIDIRMSGSGNVGTLNSFQVTRSKLVGMIVLAADLLKGVVAVLLARAVAADDLGLMVSAGLFAVVGHNYPVWLRFRGGRGLATAAGVFLMVSPLVIVPWVLAWGLSFAVRRTVNLANVIATIFLLIAVWVLPASLAYGLLPAGTGTGEFGLFVTLILTVILTKHIEPMKEILEKKRTGDRT